MQREQSAFSFKMMSLMFKIRDIVKPRKKILQDAGLKSGMSVLDFGCGPGGYLVPLAKIVGTSGKIYALDTNPAAIEQVKKIIPRKNLHNVETIVSDGPTGLPDSSIDFVLLYDVLHHLSHRDEVLAELHRVLKPDGTLSVTDHHLEENDILNRITGNGLYKMSRKGKIVDNFCKA